MPDDAYKQNIALPRKLRSGPVTAPSIDVVLVAGDQLPAVKDVCVRFAQDFDMHYLQIFDYLTELLDPRKHDRAAYGFLHPDSLSVLLDQSPAFAQTELFAFFLIPILRYKIDCEVARGRRKFLVLGLGEYINAALAFQSEVCANNARLIYC